MRGGGGTLVFLFSGEFQVSWRIFADAAPKRFWANVLNTEYNEIVLFLTEVLVQSVLLPVFTFSGCSVKFPDLYKKCRCSQW